MEQSKDLLKVFNIVLPFNDFTYILQQDEYSSRRYLKWLKRFFFRRNFQIRDHLQYTFRIKVTIFFTLFIWFFSLICLFSTLNHNLIIASLIEIIWIILIPVFVFLGNLLLSPFFGILKLRVIKRASIRTQQLKNLKIIAVTGSFGKTTTKNFIFELVRYNYRTQIIPGNINTAMGISDWINRYLETGTEILIVEMDTYKKGEIKESCNAASPDIAIITTIGDQHLERFSTKDNLAKSLSEIFIYAKPSAKLLCNADTAKEIHQIDPKRFTMVSPNVLKILEHHGSILSRFSSSTLTNLAFAIKTAELLEISKEFIIDTCEKLELPDRRQKVTTFHGYDCVDDSYNISFTTAQAGLQAAKKIAKTKKKKLLVITAGIPELGPENQDKNEILGKILTTEADHIALLKSMFYKEIAEGITDQNKYTLFKDFGEFLSKSNNLFPAADWLLLLEPELTDLYY